MIRAIINAVADGARKLFSASGREGETFEQREYMQHYGFTSRPLSGAVGVIVDGGQNHLVMIATDDRRYRITLANGEVALYTDEGDFIHLKRDKTIAINSGQKIDIISAGDVAVTAASNVTVTAPQAVVNASGSCEINSPDTTCMGNLTVSKTLTVAGVNINTHTHSGVQSGPYNTGTPNGG